MPIFENVPCPNCSRSLRLPTEVIGRSVKCPLCQTTFIAARDGDAIETIPEVVPPPAPPPPPPVPSMSLDDDIPMAPTIDDIPMAPLADDIPEAPLAATDDVEVLDPISPSAPPPPPPQPARPVKRRNVPGGKSFTPVPFVVFIQRDPQEKLEGRFQAEVDAKGLHIWRGKGRVITVERGATARHKGGARVSLEIDGRVVDLTVIHGAGSATQLAAQIVSFLNGDRDDVALPASSALPLVPLLLLPLGIPLLAALFGTNIGGVLGTALWALFAVALIAGCCGLAFGLSGGLLLRGVLAAVVVGFGYFALLVGFGIDWLITKARNFPSNRPQMVYSRPDQGFQVTMPGPVGTMPRPQPVFRDGAAWAADLFVPQFQARYQVIFGELRRPPGIPLDPNAVRGQLQQLAGQTVEERQVGGAPQGWEYRIVGATPGRARIYVSPTRAVMLIATSPNLGSEHIDIRNFLNSIRFTGADWFGGMAPVPVPPKDGPAPKPVDPADLAPAGRLLSAPGATKFVWAAALTDGRILGLMERDGYWLYPAAGGPGTHRKVATPDTITWGATHFNTSRFAFVGHNQVFFAENADQEPRPFADVPRFALWGCDFQSDLMTLATAHGDRKVRLWDARTGKLTRTLDGPTGQVTSVAFSPDGKLLAAADQNGEVRVYTLVGDGVRTMEGKHGAQQTMGEATHFSFNVRSLCFAADGRRLVSCGNDRMARVWDALTGKQLNQFHHNDAVTAAAFLPGGRLLFTGTANGEVRIHDVVSGVFRASVRAAVPAPRQNAIVRSLAFSTDGNTLVAATGNGVERWEWTRIPGMRVTFRDRQRPDPLPEVPATPGKLPGELSRLVGNGGTLVAVLADGRLRRLETPSLMDAGEVAQMAAGATEVAVSADGQALAYATNPTVNVIDPRTKASRGRLIAGGLTRSPVALTADGKRLAAVTGGTLSVLQLQGGIQPTIDHGVASASGVAVSPDGGTAAVISRSSPRVHLFDVTARRDLARMRGHEKGILDVAYSPDGKTLATLGLDGTARLWDAAASRQRFVLEGHAPGSGPGYVAFSPDGKTLAVACGTDVRFWDTGAGKLLHTAAVGGPVRGVALDDRHAYFGSAAGQVKALALTEPAFRDRPAAVTPDLSKSPAPEVPDLLVGRVEPHLALVADPASGTALAFTRDRLMLRLSFPGLQIQEAYWTGKVIYRAALDAKRGLLFAAVADPASLRPGINELASAEGPLAVYDVRALLDRKPLPARLAPKGELAVDGQFTDLLAGERLCYRVVKDGKPSVGHIDPVRLRVAPPLELPFDPTGPLALSPDGKALFVGGTAMRTEGRVARVELATLKVGDPVPTGTPPVAMACSADWVAVLTQTDYARGSLAFLGHDGKELARWKTEQRPFVAGSRLYLTRDRSHVLPTAYDVGAKPPAEMPREPAARVTASGTATADQVAVVGGRFLASTAGDLYVLGAEAVPPAAMPPVPPPSPGVAERPPLTSGRDRVTALVPVGERDLQAGRAGGAVETWVTAEGRLLQTAQAGAPLLGLARSPVWYAAAVPGGAKVGNVGVDFMAVLPADVRALGGNAIAFLPDGTGLVGPTARGLSVWRVSPGRAAVEKAVDVPSPVTAVAAGATGDVACGSADGLVRLFAAKTYDRRHELKGHEGEVRAVLLSRDGKRAFSAGVDGKVIFWDAEGGKSLKVIEAHDHVVTSLALSPDEKLLVSGSLDGSARGWDVESGRVTKRLLGLPAEPIAALAFARDGAELAAAAGTRVRRWDLGTGKTPPVVPMPPVGGGAAVVKIKPSFRDGVIDTKAGHGFFLVTSGTVLLRLGGEEFRPQGIYPLERTAFRLLHDTAGKNLYIFRSGRPVTSDYPPRGTDVELLRFEVDKFAPAKLKGRPEPSARAKLEGTILCPVLSPDGKALYYLDLAGKRVVRRDLAAGTSRDQKLDQTPTHLSLSPDGKRLYAVMPAGAGRSRVVGYDPEKLTEVARIRLDAEVLDLAGADGDKVMLATAGKALLFTMKGTQEREWNTGPDRPYVRVAADGKTGFAVVARPAPFPVQVWPMDGGAARTFEVNRPAVGPPTAVSGGDFSVSEDGTVLLIGRSGLAVRVPAK